MPSKRELLEEIAGLFSDLGALWNSLGIKLDEPEPEPTDLMAPEPEPEPTDLMAPEPEPEPTDLMAPEPEVGLSADVARDKIRVLFTRPTQFARWGTGGLAVEPCTIMMTAPVTIGSTDQDDDGEISEDERNAGRHGAVVNPACAPRLFADGRTGAAWGRAEDPFPVTLTPGDSLIVTRSHGSDEGRWDVTDRNVRIDHGPTQNAAAIICVEPHELAAAPTQFRPSYVRGADVRRRNLSQIDFGKLESLALPEELPETFLDYRYGEGVSELANRYAYCFEELWLCHVSDWVGRQSHAAENQPNYHREAYRTIADAAWLVNCDIPNREYLVRCMVQAGLEQYGASMTVPYGAPPAESADSSISRWLVLFAGWMLDDEDILNWQYLDRTRWMCYHMEEAQNTYPSAVVPAGLTWTGSEWGWRKDVGRGEHEHRSPLEAATPEINWRRQEEYSGINRHTWAAMAATAARMGFRALWNHEAFFQVVRRWKTENPYDLVPGYTYGLEPRQMINAYRREQSRFSEKMWDLYGPADLKVA